jgi:adenine-specific DNA-methyltransferase
MQWCGHETCAGNIRIRRQSLARGRPKLGMTYDRQRTPAEAQTEANKGLGLMAKNDNQSASVYKHPVEAVQRPDVGVEAQFPNKKAPKTYRYDSSLPPELCWDEGAERAFAEWLLNLVAEAAEKGETVVFPTPQVWKGTDERFSSISQCSARLRSLTKPFLNWTGKAERQQINVPTLPLFVHERHSTQAILETLKSHKAKGTNLDLFGDIELDVADKLDAYAHKGPWTNRLVLGDSLQVMNSLLEYEGMGGQIEMIYFDPPYGVKFGSNFQPFVRKNSVKHGADDEMIREPEMVKAYRDTWELGLHSYLTYLRDRLLLARELLTASGSIFIQISDDNLHHVREVLDEVFPGGFVSQISFQTTSGFESSTLPTVGDFLLWYAKDKERVRYNKVFQPQPVEPGKGNARWVLLEDGSYRGVKASEARGEEELPKGARLYKPDNIQSQGSASGPQPFEFQGKTYSPGGNSHWKANYPAGMEKLAKAGRIHVAKNSIQYIRYADDFPFQQIGNIWTDTATGSFTDEKVYVVQTGVKVIERCLQMVTEPGDLVLDITCGSGTTAYVAEQWGRRWITCDTSRVPIALARQRLLTSTFPWYKLKNPSEGPAGGFVYERKRNKKGEETGGLVPRITLRSIANDEDPKLEVLVDRAEVNDKITRVCGTFTVEATIQAAMSLQEDATAPQQPINPENPRAFLDRMIEVLRQSKTLQLPGNLSLGLEAVRPLADREYLHAEAVAKNGSEKRIAIVFGRRWCYRVRICLQRVDGGDAAGLPTTVSLRLRHSSEGSRDAGQAENPHDLHHNDARYCDVRSAQNQQGKRDFLDYRIAGRRGQSRRKAARRRSTTPGQRHGTGHFPAGHHGNRHHRSREPAVLDAGHQL